MKTKYSLNSRAEIVCDSVAFMFLAAALVGVLAFAVAALFMEKELIVYCIIGGIGSLVVGVVCWASLKVIVNISRNLFIISESLQELKSNTEKKEIQ